MNDKAFEAAKEKLQLAQEKAAAMTAATDIRMLAQLWEEFFDSKATGIFTSEKGIRARLFQIVVRYYGI